MVRDLHVTSLVSDRVLGVVAAIVVTAALTVIAAIDPELMAQLAGWRWRVANTSDPAIVLLLCGVPLGVLFGSLLGSMPGIDRLSRDGRILVSFTATLAGLLIAMPHWPMLGLFAIPLALFHAALTTRRDEPPILPVAIVRKR